LIFKNPKDLRENEYSRKLFPRLQGKSYELLKQDIVENGIQIPLSITNNGLVLRGNERLRVALELELKEVPVKIFDGDNDTSQKIWLIIDNLARKSVDFHTKFSCFGELKRLFGLKNGQTKIKLGTWTEDKMTEEEIAKETGISRKTFSNARKIQQSKLPKILKDKAYGGEAIRPIANLIDESKEVQEKVAKKVQQGLNVTKATREVKRQFEVGKSCAITTPIEVIATDKFSTSTAKVRCPKCGHEIKLKEVEVYYE